MVALLGLEKTIKTNVNKKRKNEVEAFWNEDSPEINPRCGPEMKWMFLLIF